MALNKLEEFRPYIEKGLITATHHPDDFDIVILNYTNKCQYDACWDAITSKCRGLILNTRTGEIVARPFDKFFNFFEIRDPLPPGIPEVTVKMDGSLGISYRLNGCLLWATRGSFTGPQAMVAQEIWDSKYAAVHAPDEITLLVEIVHPVTRVIVDYDFVDLVLIGARERHTGRDLSYDELSQLGSGLGLPVVERVDMDLSRALELAKTLDAQHEGFVLRWPNGFRLKVKSTKYLEAFRAVHGWSVQNIARAWTNGTLDYIITNIPEEFKSEFMQAKKELDLLLLAELQRFKAIINTAPQGVSRKEYALWVRDNIPQHLQPLAFDYFDGATIKPKTESYLRRYLITQYCQNQEKVA